MKTILLMLLTGVLLVGCAAQPPKQKLLVGQALDYMPLIPSRFLDVLDESKDGYVHTKSQRYIMNCLNSGRDYIRRLANLNDEELNRRLRDEGELARTWEYINQNEYNCLIMEERKQRIWTSQTGK